MPSLSAAVRTHHNFSVTQSLLCHRSRENAGTARLPPFLPPIRARRRDIDGAGGKAREGIWSPGYGSSSIAWPHRPLPALNSDRLLCAAAHGPGSALPDTESDVGATEVTALPPEEVTVTSAKGNPPYSLLATLRDLPAAIWRTITKPLENFGYGRRSLWEGGVGLFVLSSLFLLGLTVAWIDKLRTANQFTTYCVHLEFPQACGIAVGTPVRIRGAPIGSVVKVIPTLHRIDAIAEIQDSSIVIPRNAELLVNQSGLIAETLIDIMPLPPIPKPEFSPVDGRCQEEGVVVCEGERLVGGQGVSLDELVRVCTKLAKQMDADGMPEKALVVMDKAMRLMEEAEPLIKEMEKMSYSVEPMLRELSQGATLKNVEKLTNVAADLAGDIRELNTAILTEANRQHLRDSVGTLTKMLRHLEQISGDLSSVFGDEENKHNLKKVIETLGRLYEG